MENYINLLTAIIALLTVVISLAEKKNIALKSSQNNQSKIFLFIEVVISITWLIGVGIALFSRKFLGIEVSLLASIMFSLIFAFSKSTVTRREIFQLITFYALTILLIVIHLFEQVIPILKNTIK